MQVGCSSAREVNQTPGTEFSSLVKVAGEERIPNPYVYWEAGVRIIPFAIFTNQTNADGWMGGRRGDTAKPHGSLVSAPILFRHPMLISNNYTISNNHTHSSCKAK